LESGSLVRTERIQRDNDALGARQVSIESNFLDFKEKQLLLLQINFIKSLLYQNNFFGTGHNALSKDCEKIFF
jgi:hypothetical protein